MKKAFQLLFPLVWILILFAGGLYYIGFAEKEEVFSETENRLLAGTPDFIESIREGTLDTDTENYLLDRFPGRSGIIEKANSLKDVFSISTYEDYLRISQSSVDPLDTDLRDVDLGALTEDVLKKSGSDNEKDEEKPEGENRTGESTESEEAEEAPEKTAENPPIEEKPEADINDYPLTLSNYMMVGGKKTDFLYYSRDSVLAVVSVLNKYASVLPENGKLLFTMVPQSIYANLYVNSAKDGYMKEEGIDLINAFSRDNVYAFDAAEILSGHIDKGEYMFFRTDMHWTPLGTYYVYKEMVERAGGRAADYYEDYSHTIEESFLGTYYRDNPSDYFLNHADTLDLLEPRCRYEVRRIDGPDSYHVIPILNFDARKNDRYTVYLGGPAGPWTYAESDNGKEENALVIMDSFGLCFFNLLTQNYRQVHYVDPRYFDEEKVGCSISEMIAKYNITDIYVVVGDLHSFDSGFLIQKANSQF